MAISLKNVDDRLKVVEGKVSSGTVYTTGTGTEGRWFKFAGGLIIQCGKSGGGNRKFPIPFPNICSGFVTAGTNPTSSYNKTGFNFNDMNFGTSSKPGAVPWLAIGYLITNRLLKHAYAYVKSLRDFKVMIKSHFFCCISNISREVI